MPDYIEINDKDGNAHRVATENITNKDGSTLGTVEKIQYYARGYVTRDGYLVTPAGGEKYAKDTVPASATNDVIVTGVAGRKIRVLKVKVITGLTAGVQGTTASTYKWVSKPAGAGTDLTDAINVSSDEVCEAGIFETAAGDSLCLTTGAGSSTYVQITYIEA